MKNNMLLTAFIEFEERLAPRASGASTTGGLWRRASATRPNLDVVRAASAHRTKGEREPTYPKAIGCGDFCSLGPVLALSSGTMQTILKFKGTTEIFALLFDLEDYATTYRATRDAYLKAANELKLLRR